MSDDKESRLNRQLDDNQIAIDNCKDEVRLAVLKRIRKRLLVEHTEIVQRRTR